MSRSPSRSRFNSLGESSTTPAMSKPPAASTTSRSSRPDPPAPIITRRSRIGAPSWAEEFPHRGRVRTRNAIPAEHHAERTHQAREVEGEPTTVDVLPVESETLVPRHQVPSADLRQPGEPGAYLVTPALLVGVAL